MPKFIDMTGSTLHCLTFLEYAGKTSTKHSLWKCRCVCGKEVVVEGANVRSGNTKSCGCLEKQIISLEKTTHGHTRNRKTTPTYRSWCAMWTRCTNPNQKDHANYVDRGIQVCERWTSFENFLADMGERPEGKTIDRINPNGHYEPSNCRWADAYQQARNRRKASFSPISLPNREKEAISSVLTAYARIS